MSDDIDFRRAGARPHAVGVFGNAERADRWLERTNPQMPAGRTPAELLEKSAGAELVGRVLGQVEHGIPP